ncbi:SH3 domain-containing protein [Staphylococcus hominis]|uniref:SH3 domain-containing protein n=1 Tax=Staphylococcus hominis TaxID=1290 RepID=UPI0010F61740|nr:SH3 domain-containing protein [Staphylococcus hominis]UQA64334.1 SH3 domain-containing protein [Staphylococcus hominis subsp. hominis]
MKNNAAGDLPPNTKIEYDEVMMQDKHVWVGYDSYEGDRIYLPVGTRNGKNPLKTKSNKYGQL